MAFLRKPFNDELLIKTLNEAIQRSAGGGGEAHDFPRRKEVRGMRRNSTFESPKRHFHLAWPGIILATVFMLLSAAWSTSLFPVSVPSPSTFDRAWSAAMRGAR